jgi:hypothetical protein
LVIIDPHALLLIVMVTLTLILLPRLPNESHPGDDLRRDD